MSEKDERCHELREALADARARLEPAGRGTAVPASVGAEAVEFGDITPSGSDALRAEIRNLEQALFDAGCE